MIKQIKIYGINNQSIAEQIHCILDNIVGVNRVLIEINSSMVYIQSSEEIDDNVLVSEIKTAGFEIL